MQNGPVTTPNDPSTLYNQQTPLTPFAFPPQDNSRPHSQGNSSVPLATPSNSGSSSPALVPNGVSARSTPSQSPRPPPFAITPWNNQTPNLGPRPAIPPTLFSSSNPMPPNNSQPAFHPGQPSRHFLPSNGSTSSLPAMTSKKSPNTSPFGSMQSLNHLPTTLSNPTFAKPSPPLMFSQLPGPDPTQAPSNFSQDTLTSTISQPFGTAPHIISSLSQPPPSFPLQGPFKSNPTTYPPQISAIPTHPPTQGQFRPGPPGPPMMSIRPPISMAVPPVSAMGPPPLPGQQQCPPVPEQAPPTTNSNAPGRLGVSGLRAKRPTPTYNFAPPAGQSVTSTNLPTSMGVPTQPLTQPTSQLPGQPVSQPSQPPMPLSHSQPVPGQYLPPTQPGGAPTQPGLDGLDNRMRKMSLSDMSYIDLMEFRNIFPKEEKLTCIPPLPAEVLTKNKYPEHFCCTSNCVPSSSGLLSKLKIPFGLIIQPFKDLGDEVPVVNPPIPRCKVCRTYINPYVTLNDGGRRWKCNICSRLNDMPADYFYGEDGRRIPFDISNRAELNSSIVEYIAPSEYTTRPPQAASYLYLIDVSVGAVQSGMVKTACKLLAEELDNIPGDGRTSVGILCFDSQLYFYNLHKNSGQPQMLVVSDLDEAFIPTIDELMVNLKEHKEKIGDLLSMIPSIFQNTKNTDTAVGPALKASKELIFACGGRVTLMLSRTPSVGPGIAKKRGEASKLEGLVLSPMDDFYKSLALECTTKQVAVDLFLFPNDSIDMPTVASVSQYSSGTVYYYPQYHCDKNKMMADKFVEDFRRYLTRPIAFEAVLRIRCTSGINIHAFFGNCFVRAHDLIALANVSPDVAFGVQCNIEENLMDNKLALFQSALLYTSSKGDRRIRVHTLALPISSDPQTIYNNLNIDACISLLAKLAVNKANLASLGDAREALQYAVIDPLIKYRTDYVPSTKGSGKLVVPKSQRLLPLYISSLLKNKAFRLQNVSIDDRFFAMMQLKTLSVEEIMLMIYPRLFALHTLNEEWTDKSTIPPRISLTAEKLTRKGVFLLQTHEHIIIWVGRLVSEIFVNSVYNCKNFTELPEIQVGLNHHDNPISDTLHDLLSLLNNIRDTPTTVVTVREDSRSGALFLQCLMEDRGDGQMSYYEFLQNIQQQVG